MGTTRRSEALLPSLLHLLLDIKGDSWPIHHEGTTRSLYSSSVNPQLINACAMLVENNVSGEACGILL
jgi:hypothetical protein